MIADLLSWLVIIVMLVVFLGRRRQPQEQPLVYRRLESAEALPAMLSRSDHFEPLLLEEIPDAERRRVVFSIRSDRSKLNDDELTRLLWRLASKLQSTARAHCVVVEAFAPGQPVRAGSSSALLLYAVDGRGWSGGERSLAQLRLDKSQAPRAYSLAEVQQALLESSLA